MSALPVTYLFVPATEDRKIAKAMQSDADAIILDLEDSIPDRTKDAARLHLAKYLTDEPPAVSPQVWVRINATAGNFEADVQAVKWEHISGAVLPKAERAETIRTLIDAGAKRVLPIIESARGFKMLDRLAETGNVERFAIGTLDLAIDLGILSVGADDSELIWQLRGELAFRSRQLDLPPPVDGIHAQFNDDEGLKRLSQRAHRIGFGAKLLIHPRQIAPVRAVFQPNQRTLQHARDVIRAYDDAVRAGKGAVQLNGEMIDRPVVERARALIAQWNDN